MAVALPGRLYTAGAGDEQAVRYDTTMPEGPVRGSEIPVDERLGGVARLVRMANAWVCLGVDGGVEVLRLKDVTLGVAMEDVQFTDVVTSEASAGDGSDAAAMGYLTTAAAEVYELRLDLSGYTVRKVAASLLPFPDFPADAASLPDLAAAVGAAFELTLLGVVFNPDAEDERSFVVGYPASNLPTLSAVPEAQRRALDPRELYFGTGVDPAGAVHYQMDMFTFAPGSDTVVNPDPTAQLPPPVYTRSRVHVATVGPRERLSRPAYSEALQAAVYCVVDDVEQTATLYRAARRDELPGAAELPEAVFGGTAPLAGRAQLREVLAAGLAGTCRDVFDVGAPFIGVVHGGGSGAAVTIATTRVDLTPDAARPVAAHLFNPAPGAPLPHAFARVGHGTTTGEFVAYVPKADEDDDDDDEVPPPPGTAGWIYAPALGEGGLHVLRVTDLHTHGKDDDDSGAAVAIIVVVCVLVVCLLAAAVGFWWWRRRQPAGAVEHAQGDAAAPLLGGNENAGGAEGSPPTPEANIVVVPPSEPAAPAAQPEFPPGLMLDPVTPVTPKDGRGPRAGASFGAVSSEMVVPCDYNPAMGASSPTVRAGAVNTPVASARPYLSPPALEASPEHLLTPQGAMVPAGTMAGTAGTPSPPRASPPPPEAALVAALDLRGYPGAVVIDAVTGGVVQVLKPRPDAAQPPPFKSERGEAASMGSHHAWSFVTPFSSAASSPMARRPPATFQSAVPEVPTTAMAGYTSSGAACGERPPTRHPLEAAPTSLASAASLGSPSPQRGRPSFGPPPPDLLQAMDIDESAAAPPLRAEGIEDRIKMLKAKQAENERLDKLLELARLGYDVEGLLSEPRAS
eukprot:TRINITY_DN7050_c0_g1_i1.p1 TRINITY_DN7050_c0_g1~~TRINITY_DN7050_c0_g1_i1.p1  ORF type:complete len:915 (+),score=222.69 TRINITY_DN7050_c0_g1_i1:190-2745(+)